MGIIMNIEIQIEKNERRLDQLKAQKLAKEAREKAKQREKERKDNTRRKFLIGEMYLQQMKKDKAFNIQILNQLDFYLNKKRDRELFNLPEDYETVEDIKECNTQNQAKNYQMVVPKIELDEYKEAIPHDYKPSYFGLVLNRFSKWIK